MHLALEAPTSADGTAPVGADRLNADATPARTLTVGLVGYSTNSDNLGVGALTATQIRMLERMAEAGGYGLHIIVFVWPDTRAHYITGPHIETVTLRGRDLVSPFGGLLRNIRRCDVVFDIGAGDSFADIYGVPRFMRIVAPKLAAIAMRRPLLLAPQTVGPFERGWTQRVARFALKRARGVSTRDAASTAYLAQIGYTGPALEATDLAMRLDYAPPPARQGDGPIKVGLNVSGLLFNGGYDRANMFRMESDYAVLARSLANDFAAMPGVELHLVGHVLSRDQEVEDDGRACAQLASQLPGSIVAPRFKSPSEAKSYIAGLDFFCGSRMHACIAAFSSGVPVVPLAYSRKFAGLFGTLGYDETIDVRTEPPTTVLHRVKAAFKNREALRGSIRAALADAQQRLDAYEAAVGPMLAAAARPRR